jgi:hypothetical protein
VFRTDATEYTVIASTAPPRIRAEELDIVKGEDFVTEPFETNRSIPIPFGAEEPHALVHNGDTGVSAVAASAADRVRSQRRRNNRSSGIPCTIMLDSASRASRER